MVARSDLYRFVSREAALGPEEGVRATLGGIRVAEAMSAEPATCEANEPLEAVSERMRARKVGAFPVLHRGHLVGIISESDILRALGELAWHDSGASRLTVKFPGSAAPERTYELVELCRRHRTELLAVLTHPVLEDSATMTTLRVRGEKIDELVDALWRAGFDVVDRC
jgi:acetoin utilization protein AcuB